MKRKIASILLAVYMVLLLPISAMAAENMTFTDVPPSHWASDAITFVYENGLMNGEDTDTFCPSNALTRAMFVTILGRIAGVSAQDFPGSPFADVPAGQWLSAYVTWASQTSVVDGTGNGRFSPDLNVTREEMATMIGRYVDSADITLEEADAPVTAFADQNKVSSWAQAGVNLMRRTGILTGYEDGSFQPQRTADRAEAAAIFMRLYQMIGGNAQPATYTVSFETGGGSAVASQTVADGQLVQKPVTPTRKGSIFQEWQRKDTGTTYDFTEPVTGNLTLVAVWFSDLGEDTLYELTDDRVVIDPVNGVPYVKDILLAFVEPGLSVTEKEQIAAQVGGTIAGELSGGVNVLQICVREGTLAELEAQANQLQQDDRVFYATCDYPISSASFTATASEDTAGGGDWWYSAIRADEAWDAYRTSFGDITVGVMDGGVESAHPELSGSVSFASPYYQTFNNLLFSEPEGLNHGTHVTGIIAAKADGKGMTGVAPQAEVVFASYQAENETSWNTSLTQIHALNCLVEAGAKVINCSFGITYYDEKNFEEHKKAGKDEFQFDTYQAFLQSRNYSIIMISREIAAATCQLICADKQFLVVQAAGNGFNNEKIGVNARNASYWAGCTEVTVGEVCKSYGLTYDDLNKRMLIVSGVNKNKNGNIYTMDPDFNYGDVVDIYAPGRDIYSCVYGENGKKYASYPGTSMAAPMVTAAAALVWSVDPSLRAEEVRAALLENHRDNAQGTYVGETYTRPMLDVYSAVGAVAGENSKELVGFYQGSYTDDYGEHGLNLHIYEWNGAYRARFEFYGLPGQSDALEGSYTMGVTMDGPRIFHFAADTWIEQPSGYDPLDLVGSLQGDTLSGTSPTRFSVTRAEPPAKYTSWQQAYLDYVQTGVWEEGYWTDEIARESTYHLVDINGDSVPELWIDNPFGYSGARICTYLEGQLSVMEIYHSFCVCYLPGKNLVLGQTLQAGSRMDQIRRIEHGCFVPVAIGNFTTAYEEGIVNGTFRYNHYWNGEPILTADYERTLNAVFDMQSAVELSDAGIGMTYQQIVSKLSS